MQIPDPTSKRRSTSAAKASTKSSRRNSVSAATVSGRSYSIQILVCGLLAVSAIYTATAAIPPPPPDPFKVLHHWSGKVSTIVSLEGGHIGQVHLDAIENGDPSSIVELLQEHSEWTGAQASLDLMLTSASAGRVMFMQRVQDTLVSYDGFVNFDEYGNVTRLRSAIVNPAAVDDWPTILEADAVAVAAQALRNFHGRSDVEVHIGAPERLRLRPFNVEPRLMLSLREPDEQPEFYWRMIMVATGEPGWYIVRVNAHSAEARITPISSP